VSEIDIMLDLRGWQTPASGPGELVALWPQIEGELRGTSLKRGDTYRALARTSQPTTVIALSTWSALDSGSVFRIQGLVEPPALRRPCRLCGLAGDKRAGEFQCQTCRSTGLDTGVCSRHVRVLNGAYSRSRLLVSCQEHAPRCHDCAAAAEFWCIGPSCRGNGAWCATHRRSHRNSPEVGYCHGCYELVFPQCLLSGCQEPGVNRCEYVDRALGQACGVKLCNRHVARWQVFGYEKVGLARCSKHRRVAELGDPDVIFQVVAGTAARHLQTSSRDGVRYFLPTLGSVKNILLKGRNRAYDEMAALSLYQALLKDLQAAGPRQPLQVKMKELLERASSRWDEFLGNANARRMQGSPYFNALKKVLLQRGERELAEGITMSDFIPNYIRGDPPTPGLFVRVPDHLKPRFIGRGGANIQAYGAAIGCTVKTERESRQ
jgi:hypothetical protein